MVSTIEQRFLSVVNRLLTAPPSFWDVMILSVFTLVTLFNPVFMHDRINTFELGLYLPGMNGIMHGLVPFRDFMHLRGPLELYVPVWLMQIFGTHMNVLMAYFYFGNVVCCLMLILIAKELFQSRILLYIFVPVVVARAFPRVVFMIWGGMRYAMGLIAIYFLIKFLRSKHVGWLIACGVSSAIAALISIEMGIYAAAAVVCVLIVAWVGRYLTLSQMIRSLGFYTAAGLVGIAPWIFYSMANGALLPYLDNVWVIVTRMQIVIDPHLVSIYPHNFPEAVAAMVNPVSVNFKHMTPSFAYIAVLGVLIYRWRKGNRGFLELSLFALGIYGFIMYNTGFRGLWASQFEMALMPEKIIYFLLIEMVLLWLWQHNERWQWRPIVAGVLLVALAIWSWTYAVQRYCKRFWTWQYASASLSGKDLSKLQARDKNETYTTLSIKRLEGIKVPLDQGRDLNQIDQFIQNKTQPDDKIMMFPELGIYNYIYDRPFVGRFPIPTFAWFSESWFEEYMKDLNRDKPKYIIAQRDLKEDWKTVYLGYLPSKSKFEIMQDFIKTQYRKVDQTELTDIYERL